MSNYRLNLKTSPSRVDSPDDTTRGACRVAAARKVQSSLKFLLSVPFVVALLYFGSLLYNHERVVPRGVVTVQDFYKRYGNPPRVESFSSFGRPYYKIIGEIPAPLGFPKGHPIYIFDGTGQLIDWVGESLDAPEFDQRWSGVTAKPMDVSYFLEKFPPS